MHRLDGKVAIVTGGGQGIGVHYAKALAAEGASVAVADIVDTAGTVDALNAAGAQAIGIHVDVTSWEACRAMVDQTVQAFGGLDILVSNAGIFAAIQRGSILDISAEEWDRVMGVNARGVFFAAKAAIPELRKRGGGKIINVSSATVRMGVPNMIHYVSSKGAVDAFTRALARELGGDNICVNAIAPGFTASEKIVEQRDTLAASFEFSRNARTIKRDQVPEDLLGALLFLASKDSDFITGQSIVVDGGLHMQ